MQLPGSRRVWTIAAYALLALLIVGGGVSVWWLSRYAVKVHGLTRGVGDTTFLSADGKPWFRLDEQRHDVSLDAIAPDLQHAFVAIEDRRFYYHPGIDPIGIARAVFRGVTDGGRLEGGSTLTQQLARTLFLSNARTLGRKGKEALIALMLEIELTKPQILELYLNRVYLSAGVYGVETMAQHLYRKPARDLTLPEAALIAGLVRAPSTLSPWSNYDGALERSHVVLAQMREQQFITPDQEAAARRVRPRIQDYRQTREGASGWAKEYLRQQFRSEFGGDHPPEWQVHTTFDRAVQDAAEKAVGAGLQRLGKKGLEAALVALDPRTGDILAMVGGGDYTRSTFNRATRGRRQPGSTFKPFVYAAALERGYSPVTVLKNLDTVKAPAPGDPEWAPRNAEGDHPGELTLRAALIDSNNAAAVDLQQRVGTSAVLKLASNAGLADLPGVPSLALGTGLVTPLGLASAYTIFPGGGERVAPRALTSVVDANGEAVLTRDISRERVLAEPVAFQMLAMLRDVVDRGTGNQARVLGVRGAVGGKTGTTDEYHDAWFAGFSSSIVAVVWVGFDTPAPIGREAYAARVAVPIWSDFMKRIARARPAQDFVVPPGIHEQEMCAVSYLRPVEECPTYVEYFKDIDEIPSALCPIHQGTLKQRATRAVQGFFRSLGGRLKGLFGR
ncbi:MAG: PBP1A family penicillin-binding protein [Vicinamibacterales bacterium]